MNKLFIVKKMINIKNHKIENFTTLKTELELLEYLKQNNINKCDDVTIASHYLPTDLEVYINKKSSEESTTVIVDINGNLVGYNNGQKGNIS